MNRNDIIDYIKNEYSADIDHPWSNYPDYVVFRHKSNNKWFAVIMDVLKSKIGINSEGVIDLLNLKCDPIVVGTLRGEKGFFPAYHMNKENWISAAIDDNTDADKIKSLIDMSFELTLKK